MSRPSEYNEKTLAIALAYLENFNSEYGHIVPSVVGLAKVLNHSKDTLYRWAKDEDKKAFSDTLSKINDYQHFELVNNGLKGDINPTITKLMLANHGYSEKTSQEISGPDGKPIEHDHLWTIQIVDAEPDSTEETEATTH